VTSVGIWDCTAVHVSAGSWIQHGRAHDRLVLVEQQQELGERPILARLLRRRARRLRARPRARGRRCRLLLLLLRCGHGVRHRRGSVTGRDAVDLGGARAHSGPQRLLTFFLHLRLPPVVVPVHSR
jgi:hypothetical protein